VVSSGDTRRCSWVVVLSPRSLLSCIGIVHCCHVLLSPGCPSLLSCLRVSTCGCCMSLLACLHVWSSACHCVSWLHCCCHVLSSPGCPSSLSCSRVSACRHCTSSLACLCVWLSACHCMSWSHRHAVFIVMGHSSWCWVIVCECQVVVCDGRRPWVWFVGGDL